MPSGVRKALPQEPTWPHPGDRRVVFLIEAANGLERRLIEGWIERQRPGDFDPSGVERIAIPATRRRPRRRRPLVRLNECLAAGGDPLLAPVRVTWRPRQRAGEREVHLSDILRLGDPRDPSRLRQNWVLRREPDRCCIVAGEPAPASELRARWQEACGQDDEETIGFADFVARQAALALERSERRLHGARYKVPRFVDEDILGQPGFRGGLQLLARQLGRKPAAVKRDAARYLKEIAATHSPFVIDIAAQLIRLLYTQGYGEALHYEREELARVKSLAQQHPVVFLPSHKSNLDHLVLQYALHENGHAPNHTAGGINMNFFPVGPIVRRSGVFFIRRSFKDNPVYKFVFQHYIDFLIEKRFSLEWYIEGGRSRSGKLLPPRFGMLAYVVDAYLRGRAEDVHLIPVSIAYDQIQDVSEYADEQRGKPKEKESFGWFVGVVRRLRKRYGDIHFRFGEPVSLAKVLGRPNPNADPNPDEASLQVQKLAFEVCHRINRVTPVTEASLVTLAMLGSGFHALSVDEVVAALHNVLHYVRARRLPTVGELELDGAEGTRRALDSLVENGVVTRFSEGLEPVYVIGPEQQLAAAYYRNTVIHFFLNACVAELALLQASEHREDRVASFWDEALRLRDFLKFEFFFAEKEVFRAEVGQELRAYDPEWETHLREGGDAVGGLIRAFRPYCSHRVLRPFVEAYRIVGDLLEREDGQEFDEGRFLDRCMRLGRQYHLQRRVHSAQSVSQVLFRNALKLAANREAIDPAVPGVEERRARLAEEIRSVARRVGIIDALAAARRAGALE